MAKGRTSAPLTIAVSEEWVGHTAIQKLREQGHTVEEVQLLTQYDLILHPAAHQWNEFMFQEETKKDGTVYHPYLDAAVTVARKRKREAKV